MRTVDKIKAGLYEGLDDLDIAVNQLPDIDYR